ncbi:uncharacterized protein LOC125198733 [Salvia hispanica]|uniref:uncharacterized protein LOC125198733 n=1 Tax=Salvia hispanica TaxID=49212 RepID=UPI002009708F|nr:uncharacterized protein LOC125198733 [Salvia hispanica]
MATTRARFESLEASMTELREMVQTMFEGMEEMRTILKRKKERKKETKADYRNPFSSLGEDYEEEDEWEDENSESDESSKSSKHTDQHWKNPIRMDFSKFNGTDDPRVWLNRARQYYRAQDTPAKKWVQWASYHLDGEANQWWQWFSARHIRITWSMFEKGLLQRFSTAELEEADEAIVRLKQTGSFRSYLIEFERLVNCVPHWKDKVLLGAFMAGVQDDLAKEIRFFRPQTLEQAIGLARHADEQAKTRRTGGLHVKTQQRMTNSTPAAHMSSSSRSSNIANSVPTKRLTWAEMQAKREKNECFNCDEPFSRGHKCRLAQAFLIESGNEEEDSSPIYDEEVENGEPTISLNALVGESRGKSMRMIGSIKNETIQLLVDSGSSLNFIHPQRAEDLRLSVVHIPPIYVRVSNGDKMPCSLRFEGVNITIQGITFQTTLYGLNVCNLNVVLGLPWLESLGPVLTDYRTMTMNFEQEGCEHILRGFSPSPKAKSIEWDELTKEPSNETSVFVLMKSSETETESALEEVHTDIQRILNQFDDVMSEPKGLPLPRTYDHRITFKDENTVVNVAP